jgi:dTDP-glucose 4,6-dehydratase
MNKTIFITGGCGFIGTNFVEYMLNNSNYKIVNLDLGTYASNTDAHKPFLSDRYEIHRGDIANKIIVNRLLDYYKPLGIINFAAESHVDNSINDPSPFIHTNINGTFNLLECARTRLDKTKYRFIHISTDEVYGSLSKDDPVFTEETSYKPNSPYSASKAASDHLVRAYYHTYGLPTITTNCSNNYGPYQNKEKFIPTIIRKALAGEDIPVYGDGQQIRDWLYVEDHCKAIKLVLEEGRVGETYNIGGDKEMVNLAIVNIVCALLDVKVPRETSYKDQIKFVTDRLGHDRRYAINFNKIKNELGWKPEETFLTGINKTLDYYINK